MSVLSLRVDDDLKKSLMSEAKKGNVTLSEYIKKELRKGLVDAHIKKTKNQISDSKIQIENLAKISNEAICEVERKIQTLGSDVENIKYVKQLKKMYRVLISMSILFILAVIPVLNFNIEYLKLFFE